MALFDPNALSQIDLPKLAGAAGSLVALIIATAILASWLSAKYIPAFDRYRALTEEFRKGPGDRRRSSLHDQIKVYQARLRLLSWAVECLCGVLVVAVITIADSTLALLFPKDAIINVIGVVSLFLGLLLVVAAIVFEIAENRLDRRAIESEIGDLDDIRTDPGPDVG